MNLPCIVKNIEGTYNLTGQIQPLALSKLVEVTRGTIAISKEVTPINRTLKDHIQDATDARRLNNELKEKKVDDRVYLSLEEAERIHETLSKIQQLTEIKE